jgi:hypothetical protein
MTALSGVAVEGIIASDKICHTTFPSDSAHGKAMNVLRANHDAMRLVSHALVSDSWTTIGIRRTAAAIISGNATNHPLQKTISGRERRKKPKADTIHQTNKNTSLIFFNHDKMRVSLRNFPAILWKNDAEICCSCVFSNIVCSNP